MKFRIFYKEYGQKATDKMLDDKIIEIEEKNIEAAHKKAKKMGIRKSCRIVMIAEILNFSDFPNKL